MHTHSNVPAFLTSLLTFSMSWAMTSPLNVTLAPSSTSISEPPGFSSNNYSTIATQRPFVTTSSEQAKDSLLALLARSCNSTLQLRDRSDTIQIFLEVYII